MSRFKVSGLDGGRFSDDSFRILKTVHSDKSIWYYVETKRSTQFLRTQETFVWLIRLFTKEELNL
jgi:hypothetical protein